MNKRKWMIPIMILAINALLIVLRWKVLPEQLDAHFDLQGNASGSMSRSMLLLYPLIGATLCLISYVIAYVNHKLQNALVILSSGIGIILLLSTLVTLTSGTVPLFMLAEPVVLLCTLTTAVVCAVKSYKNR